MSHLESSDSGLTVAQELALLTPRIIPRVADIVVVRRLLTRSTTAIVGGEAAVVETPETVRCSSGEEEAAGIEVPALSKGLSQCDSVGRSVRTLSST